MCTHVTWSIGVFIIFIVVIQIIRFPYKVRVSCVSLVLPDLSKDLGCFLRVWVNQRWFWRGIRKLSSEEESGRVSCTIEEIPCSSPSRFPFCLSSHLVFSQLPASCSRSPLGLEPSLRTRAQWDLRFLPVLNSSTWGYCWFGWCCRWHSDSQVLRSEAEKAWTWLPSAPVGERLLLSLSKPA